MSMHKLTAGDGYAYLTHHVAAGDAGLEARTPDIAPKCVRGQGRFLIS